MILDLLLLPRRKVVLSMDNLIICFNPPSEFQNIAERTCAADA